MNLRNLPALALVAALALPLQAQDMHAQVSRDQAAAAAQRMTGGRVLSVEQAGSSWRVKVVTPSGEVRVIIVDASGRAG